MDRAVGVPIVREGWPFLAAIGGGAAVAASAGWLAPAAVLGGCAAFVGWFFRNPRRTPPCAPGVLVAPGDGRVVAIEQEFEPRYLKDLSVRISIFLNVFNVHVNRIPCTGTVEGTSYQPGRFLVASRCEDPLCNEQNAVMIRTPESARVLCVQVAGLIARRIVCWVSPGESVRCGERFGLIRFGSRMDIYVPACTTITVKMGDAVIGGETLIGKLATEEA
jgi:phosphatidylserine decarboxylase